MAIRVVSGSYDITDDIEGLNWSSVNPGGDETCTFTLKRSWFASSPEIERGNLLRVMDGIDVLWQGRVEETDRSGESTEQIGVTAYGLGARLKDTFMQEIYVSGDLGEWTEASAQWRIGWGASYSGAGFSVAPDDTEGRPSIALELDGHWESQRPVAFAMLDVGSEIRIASVYVDWTLSTTDPNFILELADADDDAPTNFHSNGDLAGGVSAGSGTIKLATGKRVLAWQWYYALTGAGADGAQYRAMLRHLKYFGDHSLVKQGVAPNEGFLISQMVADAVGRAAGVQLRRIDNTTFVCEQAAFRDPTKVEDVVAELNRYEQNHRTYGTWGPDSPLDTSTDGYFDYRSIDSDPTWIAFRSECDSCNLHSETATLFDTVHVNYTDASGVQRVVTRTAYVPELNGIPREESVDGGKLTTAGAETLGDAILALSGGFAPARGTVVISQPIRHVSRGVLPSHYMRADGSAFRIPDVLPSPSLFALDSTPDRRTTFPIKRIAVDAASKSVPVTTVEVDQTNDAISTLETRLAQNGQLRGG
ncbi:MAG TPA: hypothetical protein VGC63_04875 [Solirubrobacterales bacterium]|jgi:hypothetical protein